MRGVGMSVDGVEFNAGTFRLLEGGVLTASSRRPQFRVTYTPLAQMTKPEKGSTINIAFGTDGALFRVLDVTDDDEEGTFSLDLQRL